MTLGHFRRENSNSWSKLFDIDWPNDINDGIKVLKTHTHTHTHQPWNFGMSWYFSGPCFGYPWVTWGPSQIETTTSGHTFAHGMRMVGCTSVYCCWWMSWIQWSRLGRDATTTRAIQTATSKTLALSRMNLRLGGIFALEAFDHRLFCALAVCTLDKTPLNSSLVSWISANISKLFVHYTPTH